MALLKAFVCQVFLLGIYKLLFEQVVENRLVPDELTRNCLVGLICLMCFGIQLYTDKFEDQTGHGETPRTKGRRRTSSDAAETVSEFLDERTAHMMRTLDAAMQQMNQMPIPDAYVQNVIFAAAGPEDAVYEQTFMKQPAAAVVEDIHMTKLDDVIYTEEKPDVSAKEPIVMPVKVEEDSEDIQNDQTESEEEEEMEEEDTETKSDVCEEEEDVVTVIDVSKPKPVDENSKPEAVESEEDEEDEEDEEEKEISDIEGNKKSEKSEEKSDKVSPKVEEESDEHEQEDSEEEHEQEDSEEEHEHEEEEKQNRGKMTKKL